MDADGSAKEGHRGAELDTDRWAKTYALKPMTAEQKNRDRRHPGKKRRETIVARPLQGNGGGGSGRGRGGGSWGKSNSHALKAPFSTPDQVNVGRADGEP
jgi:hypothetical protein